MSFDLYFVRPDLPIAESMSAIEEAAGQSRADLSEEQLARWADITQQCNAALPKLEETVSAHRAELFEPRSGASLRMNGDELSAGSTHWYGDCCRGAQVANVLATFAAAVEDATGLRAHDPQTGGWFSQYSVQWFDHDIHGNGLRTYFSPHVHEMKSLRSTKGDEDRRKLANSLVAHAEPSDLVHVGYQTAHWLTELALPGAPYEPKREDLSLEAGQKMHKKNGFQIDLIRNVPQLIAALSPGEEGEVRERVMAIKDPAWLEAKIAEHPRARDNPDYRERWEGLQDQIDERTADAVIVFRRDLISLLQAAEESKRKVLTLTRWKDWFPPIKPPG